MTINRYFRVLISTAIFFGNLFVLSIFAYQAKSTGLLPLLHNQVINDQIIIFTVLYSIPFAIITLWPVLVKHEMLLPPIQIKGCDCRLIISRWRFAFLTGLLAAFVSWVVL